MVKKNGFVFVETILSIIILTTALIVLYTSFNKILQAEKTRIYYDDVNYIYRTMYIKNYLNNKVNLAAVINEVTNNENIYQIGTETSFLFSDEFGMDDEENIEFYNTLRNDFEVNSLLLIKRSLLSGLKGCTDDTYTTLCTDFMSKSMGMKAYIKTLSIDSKYDFILAAEYKSCSNEDNCRYYYSWVGVV